LHGATIAALALPEVHDQLREQVAEVVGGSPADLAASDWRIRSQQTCAHNSLRKVAADRWRVGGAMPLPRPRKANFIARG